jgi:sec-independent protein translocase protein TatA
MGFGGLGMWEILLILLVLLLVFGAKRLPELGGSLGKGIREFKRSVKDIETELKAPPEEPRRELKATPVEPAAKAADREPAVTERDERR